ETGLVIDGADERFVQAGGEAHPRATAGLLFAAAETRTVRQTQPTADLGERGRGHERRAQRGQLALGRIGEPPIQLFADDEIDDRVTEELEPLEIANTFPDVLVQI